MENSLVRLNASAGSGKTYSLVKNYIATLLKSSNPKKFRQLLAITFTNKAVAEMKSRILETLGELSNHKEDTTAPPMLNDLMELTGLTAQEVTKKAETILQHILHNYAGFDVVTIDTLTHRIIRTFSKDLNLPSSFEVSLDQQTLTALAVDALIAKAGQDDEITKTLVNFALEKTDDDKSWDIARDLNEIAQLLHKENDAKAIALLRDLSLQDFRLLAKELKFSIKNLELQIQEVAQNLLGVFESLQLEEKHFSRGSFFKFMVQAADAPSYISFTGTKWKEDIYSHSFYSKSQPDYIKETIDSYQDQFIAAFEALKKLHYEVKLRVLFRSKLTPLSVLQLIQKELNVIKTDENILLISDFNKIINKSLKDEPAAFIYERLGERYSNYFIDEFQDTSTLQWSNLIPLIENALSTLSADSNPNSLLIVGDPKQAIYRWRGGEAEQFMELGNESQPFALQFDQETLGTNYRSHEEVIHFNNDFFTHLASIFDHPDYAQIYTEDNNQKTNHRKGGFVSIDFIEATDVKEANDSYPEQIMEIIKSIIADGRPASEICILTRQNKDGAHIAQVLTEHGIQVVSSDSLLIHSSPIVVFLHDLLEMFQNPEDPAYRLEVLYFLGEHLSLNELHSFYAKHIEQSLVEFIESLSAYEIYFDIPTYEALGLYERLEYFIRAFKLEDKSDAYVLTYLDKAHQYALKHNGNIPGFLAYWDEKKEKASIAVPAQKEAVTLMSIHKSKGLEFPIVIFPYADSFIYSTKNEHHWYPLEEGTFNDFHTLMIPHSSVLEHIDDTTLAMYTARKNQQQFDSINVLYVALTRAVERLYVISRFRESKNNTSTYNDLFIGYLRAKGLFEQGKMSYTFGTALAYDLPPDIAENEVLDIPFTSTSRDTLGLEIATQAAFLWDENIQNARAYGILLHLVMAKIKYRSQEELAIEEATYEGLITKSNDAQFLKIIRSITNHPKLMHCFTTENKVHTERTILSSTGQFYVPDRVEIHPDGTATLIDYKTGIRDEKHKQQMMTYTDLLTDMGYMIKNRLLIYISDSVEVIAV